MSIHVTRVHIITMHVYSYKNGTKVLYLIILRALYGCIQSALLWYNLYSNTLVEEGFIINPYDKCVANKVINGKQCTIAFYVDDNKVSHEDPGVVSKVIQNLKEHFGDLKVVRGNKHTFLGMNIEILGDKKIQIDMREQLQEAIDMFPENTTMKASSPASRYLFQVDDNAKQLNKEQSEIFHSTVAKLLFIAKRARLDIEPTVAFLCTRVTKSDVHDWKKLSRLLSYIRNTIDDKRIIGASSIQNLFTWIDAAYAVYKDMKGQTGGCMSMGYGVIHGRSSK